jgi:tetratricopeptide (TPR) repeat protein/mono/diheme cytochrome c family protein
MPGREAPRSSFTSGNSAILQFFSNMAGRRWLIVATSAAALAITASFAERVPPGRALSAVHAQRPAVTFTEHVAPIVFNNCAPCHRPDGVAPFSLLTYEDAKNHAREIVAATRDRVMPPWKPEPGYGQFLDERRLTDDQIATLRSWLEGGAVEGDPARLPALPKWNGEWALGDPDLVLQTPSYTLRAAGEDVYRNFVLPIGTSQTRYVRAWQFLAGNTRVVHHATMQFDPTGASRQLDARDPEPGYEGLIPHSVGSPEGFFLGWLPGHTPYIAPEGMAWPLPPRTDLVMMLHLRPSGKEEEVRASLGLYFSDGPPRLNPLLIRLTRQHMDIPPGERRYVVTDSFVLDADVDVYTVQPHAHHLATEVKSYATLPDGTRTWLILIRQWDFEWQGVFRYARPPFLPAGTTITMEYTYDNSAENHHNPQRPPRRVTYGERTTDEMAELWLQVVPRRAADGPRLARAVRARIVREDIVGLEKRLEADPRNSALHDDVALLYAEAGQFDRTAAHFAETARLKPDSAAAHYNLGNVRFREGRRAEAIDELRKAIALKSDYSLAHDGLGVALYGEGKVDEAVEHYRQALAVDQGNVEAHLHLAIALRSLGRLADAIPHYRQVLLIDPSRQDVRTELAEVERQLAAPPELRR